jgi:hypothetical protein
VATVEKIPYKSTKYSMIVRRYMNQMFFRMPIRVLATSVMIWPMLPNPTLKDCASAMEMASRIPSRR